MVTVISEGLYLLLQLINNFGVLDLRPLALVQTLGVLLLTTLVSFLFMVIPYVLYLLFLPSARVNGRVDRAVTCSLFALFVFLTLFEKAASWVFWDEFQSAFNFIAVDYLVYTHEVIANINESYPMGWILSALLLLTASSFMPAVVFFSGAGITAFRPPPVLNRGLRPCLPAGLSQC